MKPEGRKHYRNKSGSGKHHIRINGKFHAWWTDVCSPSKARAKKAAAKEIDDQLMESGENEEDEA